MQPAKLSLDDKYTAERGRVFLTGSQALVRLPLVQRRRDLAAGLNTAGFISGYRGSPLGGYDQQLWAAKKFLDEHHIRFQPSVNQDLAAPAVLGTQQAGSFGDARSNGVFGHWEGTGPGGVRTGGALKQHTQHRPTKHRGRTYVGRRGRLGQTSPTGTTRTRQ